MSYTIAPFIGMKPRSLEELVPAESLETLESLMKHWAGKLYEPFEHDIDKGKICDHIKWIYATHKLQAPKVVYTCNPEQYKSLVADALINAKDTPVHINMKGYLSRMVKIPAWFSLNVDSETCQIERVAASLKNIIARVAFKNSKEFEHFILSKRDVRRVATSETRGGRSNSPSHDWLPDAQLNHMFNGCGLWADSGWFFLFDLMSALGIRKNELIDRYRRFLKSGVFASMFFKNNAVIVIQPQVTQLTDDGKLHCDGGPAMQWADGHKTYALHNVHVPEHIALTPHYELNPMLIVTEKNAEIRREIVRKIGAERMVSYFGAVVIDKYEDYELIELTIKEIAITARYLKTKNPSIGTWHIEGVPPDIKTCLEALQWRIGGLTSQAQD
ncbi:MAG: hypothetical protein HQK97_02315 [Nitrospirae bacterium]|nr:hypothetical protein [Nitrospirota bacterium]